ncbi:hypothetical protein T265_07794 [Opisthorchis viverrini]|uniref:RRM domain-containing protein n=2 Tax=Opisthorchis viverrini TaxID=6198 RepID=A0A075AAL4_OPIVI|nr:hypothetical protein T265_07794 [Opisthorchis viverrini]KER24604.1 hypothetical protein T265_07794 [Opisthorchis viverrini]
MRLTPAKYKVLLQDCGIKPTPHACRTITHRLAHSTVTFTEQLNTHYHAIRMFIPRKNCLHIRNLPDSITYNDVWLEFKKFGEVVNVTIPMDVNTAKAKDCDDAARALNEMHGILLWGRILTVQYSRSYPKTSREMALRSQLQPLKPIISNGPSIFSSALLPCAVSPSSPKCGNRRWSSRSSSRSLRRSYRRNSSDSSFCSSDVLHPRKVRRSRRSRARSGSSCYRSRSETRSYSARYVRKWTVSPKGARSKSRRRSSLSDSDDETDKFSEAGYYGPEIDLFSDDLPDSVVIAANLMNSSSSSLSTYSSSSQSSESPKRTSRRKRHRRTRRPRSRRHRRRQHSASSSGSASCLSTD